MNDKLRLTYFMDLPTLQEIKAPDQWLARIQVA